MFNILNSKDSKKNKKKNKQKPTPVPQAVEPTQLQPAGSYLRENGSLFLYTEFDKEKIMPIVGAIAEYQLLPENLQPERIMLFINSPGGQVDSALMLIDVMKSSTIPVDTFVTGVAASCGILTAMAGERRYASWTSQLMSHQYAAGSRGKEHELFGRIKSFEHTSHWMIEHYKKCTGLSEKKIRKHLLGPTDVWLNAEEALEFNIIDEVVYTY